MTTQAFVDSFLGAPARRGEGARIHYRVDGTWDAPALVFSNSLGADLAMWEPQIAALGPRHRIVRYDNRGHGASAVAPGASPGEYSMELLANDVLAVMDHLGLERVSFCGISMGGMIGMWLALHVPKRVNKLALCSTAAQIGATEAWNARMDAVRKDGMQAVAEATLQRWFTAPFHEREPAAVDRIRKMLLGTSREGYAACGAAVRDADFRDSIARVRSQTLVISGAKDPSTPPADGRFLAERIPGAKFVELDAAHLSNIEAAQRFTEEISMFFGS